MTPLRQKMIDLMTFRQFSPKTHQAYLGTITHLSDHYHCSPAKLSEQQVIDWLMQTANERTWSPSTVHQALMGLKFLYSQVLEKPDFNLKIALPKRSHRIPLLLTQKEVFSLLSAPNNLKHLTLLSLCYGCGLRVSELVSLTQDDIDSERLLLRVVKGKGKKDRNIPLSNTLIHLLKRYWRAWHPNYYLFGQVRQRKGMSVSSAQKVFTQAKKSAGIDKKGGIHSLRHAYATHQLENGLPIHQLQKFLGHSDINLTLRYLHWLPESHVMASDLLAHFTPDAAVLNTQLKVTAHESF